MVKLLRIGTTFPTMKSVIVVGSLFVSSFCTAQEEEKTEVEGDSRHSIGLAIGHGHTFEGRDEDGNRKTLALPMWSIDYNFRIDERWALGLHTDLIIQRFFVEKERGGELTERSYPIAPAVMGMYSITKHWQAQLGTGVEFASEGNIFLIRGGIEYGVELRGGWEVFGSTCFDIKWDTYETWTLGLGVAKHIGH